MYSTATSFAAFAAATALVTGLASPALAGERTGTAAHRSSASAPAHSTAAHGHEDRGGRGSARRAASFAVGGTVTAVDSAAGTLTVAVHGGQDRRLRGTSVVVSVPGSARVEVDDSTGTLADVAVGDHVTVKGSTVADGSRVATRVSASSPDTDDE